MATEHQNQPDSGSYPSEIPLLRVTDPVGYIFREGTREASDELPKIKSAFEGAQIALKLTQFDITTEELVQALIDNKSIPETVSLYQAPATPAGTDKIISHLRQSFIIPQLGDFAILSDKDGFRHGFTYGQGFSNKKLLDILDRSSAIDQTTEIENGDDPSIIDHKILTPFDGIIFHLGIRQDKLETDGNYLNTEYFKVSISAKEYADKLSS